MVPYCDDGWLPRGCGGTLAGCVFALGKQAKVRPRRGPTPPFDFWRLSLEWKKKKQNSETSTDVADVSPSFQEPRSRSSNHTTGLL